MRGSNHIRRRSHGRTRLLMLSLIILALVACALPLYRAGAATPSSGTLAPSDVAHVTWDGPPRTATAPDGEGSCVEGENCDTFTLTLTGQPADWVGKKVLVKISWTSPASDYDLYVHKGSATGPIVDQDGASPPTTSETAVIDPAVHGTGVFAVHVVYFATTTADPYHGDASVFSAAVTPTPKPATQATGVKPRYQNHTPTEAQLATGKGTDAGEPTVGSNWKTGKAMYQSYLTTFRVTFNDACPSTPSALWEDKSAPSSQNSLDPILWTANRTGAAPNRTFVSQLSGTTSLSSYTDDDGDTWVPNQGGSGTSGVDHQSIGGGPYHAPIPAAAYPNAIYYCSQDVAFANCARSDDGGLTYGPAVPIFNINECAGLHGMPKVSPSDGTVYVPNSNCIPDGVLSYTKQAVIVSEDNGLTWNIRPITDSKPSKSDPSLEIGRSGRVYFGYANDDHQAAVAVSDNRGATWKNISDVGASHGIKNVAFPAVVAGDNDRAAMTFFGSKTAGTPDDLQFDGFWNLYIAHTYDGGLTWVTVDVTPNDPIQRGGIWLAGGSPIHRNLLDFFDATIDAKGRVLIGYDDGCFGGSCVQAPDASTGNSYTQLAVIARQTGGRRLFAAFDPPSAPTKPGAPFITPYRDGSKVRLEWSQSDDGGSPITGYKIYRSSGGIETLIKQVGKVTSYEDIVPDKTQTYDYRVVAINAVGESCGDNQKSAPPLGGACTSYILDIDPTGDQKSAPANQDLDIQTVSISEPSFGLNEHKLTFQMKVANLSTLLPNRQWRILWNYPNGPGGANEASFAGRYYIGMNTDNTGQVNFEYGIVTNIDASPASTQTPVKLGNAEAGSNYKPDGTITIVISNNKIGNPGKGDLLGTVIGRTFAGNGDQTVRATAAIDLTVPYSTPNFATYLLNGNTCVDLVVTKTSSVAAAVHVGQNLTYTVRVKNKGRTTATGVVMTDTLPNSVTFVSATSTKGTCKHVAGIVTCNIGTMPGSDLVTNTILVRPRTPGQIRNFASATSKEGDNNPASNSSTVSNTVIP